MPRFVTTLSLIALLCAGGCRQNEAPPANDADTSAPADAATQPEPAAATGTEAADVSSAAPMPEPAGSTTNTPPEVPAPPTPAPSPLPATASTNPAAAGEVDLSQISEDGALALVLRPAQAMDNPVVRGIIAEIEQADSNFKLEDRLAEMRQQLGVDVNDMDHVLVSLDRQHLEMLPMLMFMMGGGPGAMPVEEEFAPVEEANCDDLFDPNVGPGADEGPGNFGPGMEVPPPTVVVKFTKPVDGKKLAMAGGPAPEERQHGGQTYYFKPHDRSAAWFRDPTTAIIASEGKVQGLIDGQTSQPGPLAAKLAPIADRELALVLDVRPLHGLLSQMAQQTPMAAMAGGLVKQVETLTLAADLNGANLLQLQLHAINDSSAQGLQGMLGGLLQQGQMAFAQQMQNNADRMEESEKALVPIAEQLVNGSSVTAEGAVCSVTIPRPDGLEQLPSLLRPLIAKSRTAAQSSMQLNNLKMIGIAFHNYMDVYRTFPAAGGPGVDGAPGKGLSWRVHLLPFVEEAPLYEQFNLDEPWDSEHNQQLIGMMPEIFGSDPEGKTSIHVFTGEGAPFQEEQGIRFRDVRDGTSNTILLVEAGPSTAEIWTKPGGLPFNADDPLSVLGDIGDAFSVLMMDASSRRLPADIDPETLKRLIQPNDGEPVQIP